LRSTILSEYKAGEASFHWFEIVANMRKNKKQDFPVRKKTRLTGYFPVRNIFFSAVLP